MEIRKKFDRVRCGLTEFEESRTDESQAEQTNINYIVEKFTRTGKLPHSLEEAAQYGDVSHLNEDLTVLIQRAEEVRERVNGYMEKRKNEQDAKAEAAGADIKDAASAPGESSAPGSAPDTGDPG